MFKIVFCNLCYYTKDDVDSLGFEEKQVNNR